jgi:hypothetical protein
MMRPKLGAVLLAGLFCLVLLTGCLRSRLGNPVVQPAATQAGPSVPTPTAALATAVDAQQPAAATQAGADVQPTSAVAEDNRKAADDLSNMLDDLTKDLDTADDLNDVK